MSYGNVPHGGVPPGQGPPSAEPPEPDHGRAEADAAHWSTLALMGPLLVLGLALAAASWVQLQNLLAQRRDLEQAQAELQRQGTAFAEYQNRLVGLSRDLAGLAGTNNAAAKQIQERFKIQISDK